MVRAVSGGEEWKSPIDGRVVISEGVLLLPVRTYLTLRVTCGGKRLQAVDVAASLWPGLRSLIDEGLVREDGDAYVATRAGEQVAAAPILESPGEGHADVIRIDLRALGW